PRPRGSVAGSPGRGATGPARRARRRRARRGGVVAEHGRRRPLAHRAAAGQGDRLARSAGGGRVGARWRRGLAADGRPMTARSATPSLHARSDRPPWRPGRADGRVPGTDCRAPWSRHRVAERVGLGGRGSRLHFWERSMLPAVGRVLEDEDAKTIDQLWASYKASGARDARDKLIVHYSPLVKYVAGRVSVG